MAKERKEDILFEIFLKIGLLIATFLIFYLILLYFTNKAQFLRLVINIIIFVVIIIGGIFLSKYLHRKRIMKILKELIKNNEGEYLSNFIARFGREVKKGWGYRNYIFDPYRLNDLRVILNEKGYDINIKDLCEILGLLIEIKEMKVTAEGIIQKPQLFANLDETDFEKLNCRLFEAMDYKVEHIGHPKDQGGDLIINKGPERIVIQAKRYLSETVGNKAVQEVVAARNYYNCNGAIVIASSDFTQEAIALARANNTKLINKQELQRLLFTYLKENWA